MKEKSSTSKKKSLTYYLVLVACLLAVAAISVGIVFAVRANTVLPDSTIDSNGDNNDNNDNDGDGEGEGGNVDPDDDPNVNTNTATEFIMPIANINLSQAYTFWHDTTMGWYCLHQGVDFTAEAGSEVLAAVDGTVTEVSTRDVLYGGSVTISHANGVQTVYRFIDVDEDLKVGASVSRGDVIGTVAAPVGNESEVGSHLHFEVYSNGKMVDPDDYLNLTEK